MNFQSIKTFIEDVSTRTKNRIVSFFTPSDYSGDTQSRINAPLHESITQIVWSPCNTEEDISQRIGSKSPLKLPATNTKNVIVSFFNRRYEPIQNVFLSPDSVFWAEVWLETGKSKVKIDATVVEEETRSSNIEILCPTNKIQIVFSGQRTGRYEVILYANDRIVRGFPSVALVVPAEVDHESTSLVGCQTSTLLISSDCSSHDIIRIDPKDKFNNRIVDKGILDNLTKDVQLVLWKRIDSVLQREDMVIFDIQYNVQRGSMLQVLEQNSMTECICIEFSFGPGQEGWYTAEVVLQGKKINMPKNLTFIVISPEDQTRMNNIVSCSKDGSRSIAFDAKIVGVDNEFYEQEKKHKKVSVQLSGKQVLIKEYVLKFIPKKIYAFRLSQTTKIDLVYNPVDKYRSINLTNRYQGINSTIIKIDDGCQNLPQLIFTDKKLDQKGNGGTLFAFCYHKRLLQQIGGSENFYDKRNVFYKKLLEYHQERRIKRSKISLRIDRDTIVRSSYNSTKWLSDSQWVHLFKIEFRNELGIDEGGVRREWFEVLCRELFSPNFNLFVQAEEGRDTVHPNPHPNSKGFDISPMKLYSFAGKIVGKSVIESAYGSTYQQQIPVRLAKSFLALIVGLRVQYKHFSYDMPDFYNTKVQSIIKGNVDDESSGMNEMTFSEEEYDVSHINSPQLIELKPNGLNVKVTDTNKYEYLNLLAQYRLCNRFQDQSNAFLEGFYSLVPDSLLSLFDEHELELLLCGTRDYDLSELKRHHTIVAQTFTGSRAKVLKWFWVIVSNFSTDQMAKLLQFTTGSSHLPHGGFASLVPNFQILGSGERNSLPTARTCFNMICLPDYDEFSYFEQSLLIAITEGNEGFGLS